MAAMFDCRLLPSNFFHPYYHVNTYINCYAPIMEPINGKDMWQQTGLPIVLPFKLESQLADQRRLGEEKMMKHQTS